MPLDEVTQSLVHWIVEARHLGLPPGAFTVLLDADPCSLNATSIFDVIHLDVAWQIAFCREATRRRQAQPNTECWEPPRTSRRHQRDVRWLLGS
ncbi:hypothetical protein QBC38DRAFT_73707 [Podospora fimiseda]|uniref:Uncharacterized protein n=1 Tax=Podospora fimiseda TaxID=252190 RepID=A0AAN6YRM7_9PEZI|nr:hypothetical protein QBC38DRAFT_73707 [Podospora fimiseda]